MKRSEINRYIAEAESFFAAHQFSLPPFAFWTPQEWPEKRACAAEIVDCGLGWDLTDFGLGDFLNIGLLLFTIRNGRLGDPRYPKTYAEKIMIVREGQITLSHTHIHKTEDIIVRGGGNLMFELHNAKPGGGLADTPVRFHQDGVERSVPAGGLVRLTPGESITLTPGIYHKFWGETGCGTVLVGEVSSTNDDHTDNVFLEPLSRFPSIAEDEPKRRLIVGDYAGSAA